MSEQLYAGSKAMINFGGSFLIGGVIAFSGLGSILGGSIAGGVATLIVSSLFIGIPFLIHRTTRYVVTEDRASEVSGLLSRKTSEIELADVRNVQVTQGQNQRMFGVGSVAISTAGQSGFEVVFKSIKDPNDVADIVRKAQERLREKAG
jgi:uncharacterized membrane protein YdbT with pleckstrin-like domain